MTTTDLGAGLHWSIKRTFVMYVAKVVDGQILGKDVQMGDATTFIFTPAEPQEASLPDVDLAFAGEVIFQAHGGALFVRIANPRVHIRDGRGVLTVDNPQSATGRGTPMELVTFSASAVDAPSGHLAWRGTDVRLTIDAVPLFSLYYGEGEQFDDVTVVVPAP